MRETVATDTPDRASARRRLALAGGLLLVAFATSVGVLAAVQGYRLQPKRPPQLNRLTDTLEQTLQAEGVPTAVAQYRAWRERGFAGIYESEASTNSLGYKLLAGGDSAGAIKVFELNAETHPRSANVYDSLAEAHVAAGHTALAIESYRKAVAINPKMKSAVGALAELTHTSRPPYRPTVFFHISAGLLGLLSGAAAMFLKKGSHRHRVVGHVFVVSMLAMSATGAYMALAEPDGVMMNFLMGSLTFYLVATAWLAARRRTGQPGIIDRAALLVALGLAVGLANYGLRALNGTTDGVPTAAYFGFCAVALLASLLDLRMIVYGGVSGAARITRHLWRVTTALFIGVTSLFLGQPQVFPEALRNSGLLAAPGLLVAGLLIFWLIRVVFTGAFGRAHPPKARLVGPATI